MIELNDFIELNICKKNVFSVVCGFWVGISWEFYFVEGF